MKTISEYKKKSVNREYDLINYDPKGKSKNQIIKDLKGFSLPDDLINDYVSKYYDEESYVENNEKNNFEKNLDFSTAAGVGMEAGKMAVNASRWARNDATTPPPDIQFKRTSLLNPNLVDPDYSPVVTAGATAIENLRQSGSLSTYLNAIHRNTLKSKMGINAQASQLNAQIKNQVAQVNAQIEGQNNAGQMNVDVLNANRNYQFGQNKQKAQEAIVNSIFDNATNMGNYVIKRNQQLEGKRMSDQMMALEERRLKLDY